MLTPLALTKRALGQTGLDVTGLSHPEMDTTIVGTLRPEHLAENVRIAQRGPLPPDIYAEARCLDAAAG
jgi:hypothetical protein